MPRVDVKDLGGKTVGQVELADEVFAAKVNPHLLHETVRNYLARQRAGTHKTKEKSEVSGAGRKLWRQKGTGRARIGSIRSPLWRHGGTVHGPRPRDYSYELPRKMVTGALRSALSAKLAEEKLTVVEAWALETHKTKPFRESLTKLDGGSRTILLIDNGENRNLELASRNLDGVKLVPTTKLEAYDLLRHEHVMLSKEAALKLSGALSQTKSPAVETVQIEGAPARPAAAAVEKKSAKSAKAARKPPARAKAKPAAKPKKKKD